MPFKDKEYPARMSFKRKLFYSAVSMVLFILALFFILICLYFYIPVYVNSELKSSIPQKTGIEDFTCNVRNISFTGADLASLRIGDGEHTALSAETVRIDYSLPGLYRKHIKKVVLSGIELRCTVKDGKFALPGFDLQKFLNQLPSAPSSADASRPFSVGSIEIRNAAVICIRGKRGFRLPVEFEIVPGTPDWKILNCALRIYPRGQEILFIINILMNKNEVRLKFDADDIHLERFADFSKLIPELILSGETDIKGDAVVQLDPFELSVASARCEFRDNGSAYKNFKLGKNADYFRMEIHGNGGKEWSVSASLPPVLCPLPTSFSPLPLEISDLRCDLKIMQSVIEGSGNFKLVFPYFFKEGRFEMPDPLETHGNFFANFAENGKWEFGVTVLDRSVSFPAQCKFSINHFNIVSGMPKFDIFGKGEHAKGKVGYSLILSDISATADTTVIRIPSVSVRGNANFGDDFNADGVVKVSDAGVASPGLDISGIYGTVPLKWPCKELGPEGKISVKAFQLEEQDIGSLRGSVQQNKSGFVFKGAHHSKFIPGLTLNFTGKHLFAPENGRKEEDHRTEIRFASHHTIAPDIDLERFSPYAEGIMLNGELEINGEFVSGNKGMRCSLNSSLSHANLLFREKDVAVEGIDLSFSMPDLFQTHSAPGQQFSFRKASFGGFILNDGRIEFQIESDGSVFIEKSSVRWCRGNVGFQALRISPGIADYDLMLYCDRLNLAMILEQLGAGNAKGEGTVNGKIPVRLKDGKIRFSDAFLFSTPGQGGTIHLTGAEMLFAGIPKNTSQYAQIDLAREALKKFDYKWAKLSLTTEGEDLKVGLQFDGKPARPLPFIYKKEMGGFARVEAGSKGSHFQGIRLDVNMGLPLDKILLYKDIMK